MSGTSGVTSLSINIPLELVHPHNDQNPKITNVIRNNDYSFEPVKTAKELRSQVTDRNRITEEVNFKFLVRTRERSNINPDQSPEEIEKLKQKFRVLFPLLYYYYYYYTAWLFVG